MAPQNERKTRKSDFALASVAPLQPTIDLVVADVRAAAREAARWRDFAFGREGAVVAIRRSKRGQEGEGEEVAIAFAADPSQCAVRALQAWLAAAAPAEGHVFGASIAIAQPARTSRRGRSARK